MNRQQWAKRSGRTSSWIRAKRRQAIYARDGFACVYCQSRASALSLDHVVPRTKGGTHAAENLLTACLHCNFARGSRSLAAFCRGVSERTGEPPRDLANRIRRSRARRLTAKLKRKDAP